MTVARKAVLVVTLSGCLTAGIAGAASATSPAPQAGMSPSSAVASAPYMTPGDDVQAQGVYNTVRITNDTGKDLKLTDMRIKEPSGKDWWGTYEQVIEGHLHLWRPLPNSYEHDSTIKAGATREYGVTAYSWATPVVEMTFKDDEGRTAKYETMSYTHGGSLLTKPLSSDYWVDGVGATGGQKTNISIQKR
ncbi:hypothetical protein [Streptomyces sp. NPDC008121]|uniref:hypothetical protein n=1 Tax=Streptomyces sp. NPDC008121 TaxID=3364809 RepID=UPI0036E4816B